MNEPIFENEEPIGVDCCFQAKGDSMIYARIFDGDLVLVNRQAAIENGDLCLLLLDNAAMVRRVYFEGNEIVLFAENPMYKSVRCTLDQIRIIGKPVGVIFHQ